MADTKLTSIVYLQKCHTAKHCHFTNNFSFQDVFSRETHSRTTQVFSSLVVADVGNDEEVSPLTNAGRRVWTFKTSVKRGSGQMNKGLQEHISPSGTVDETNAHLNIEICRATDK